MEIRFRVEATGSVYVSSTGKTDEEILEEAYVLAKELFPERDSLIVTRKETPLEIPEPDIDAHEEIKIEMEEE